MDLMKCPSFIPSCSWCVKARDDLSRLSDRFFGCSRHCTNDKKKTFALESTVIVGDSPSKRLFPTFDSSYAPCLSALGSSDLSAAFPDARPPRRTRVHGPCTIVFCDSHNLQSPLHTHPKHRLHTHSCSNPSVTQVLSPQTRRLQLTKVALVCSQPWDCL